MASIPPPDFSNNDDGENVSEGQSSSLPRSGPGFAPPRGPIASQGLPAGYGVGGVKRDHRGAAKYDFSRALKFITGNNPQLDDELQVMRVFSAGGAVELIYNLPPWTYVEYPSSDEANRAFFILDRQCIVRSLFRTDELLDNSTAPSTNAGGGGGINRGMSGDGGRGVSYRGSGLGYRGGDRGDRRGGPPRLRTDHDFYKQLKFKTTANGQIGEEDVKRIFGAVGKVTKVYQLGPWTFVEYPSSEEANKAWDVISKKNEIRQLFRTNELIDALKKVHLKALRELAGLPEEADNGGDIGRRGGFRGRGEEADNGGDIGFGGGGGGFSRGRDVGGFGGPGGPNFGGGYGGGFGGPRGGFDGYGGGFGGHGGGYGGFGGDGYGGDFDMAYDAMVKRRRMMESTAYPLPHAYRGGAGGAGEGGSAARAMGRVPPPLMDPMAAAAAGGEDDDDDDDVSAGGSGFNPFQPAADMMMGGNYNEGGPAGFGTKREKFAFEKQLKFKTADNGAMPERKVRQLFEFGGFTVTKVVELGAWTFVEYPNSEDAEKAFNVMKKHNFVAGLLRTEQLRDFARRAKDKVVLKFKVADNPTLTDHGKVKEIFSRPGEVASIAEKEDEDGEKWIHVDYSNMADSQKAFALIDGWEYNGEDSVQNLRKEVTNDFHDPDEPTPAQRKMMSPFGGGGGSPSALGGGGLDFGGAGVFGGGGGFGGMGGNGPRNSSRSGKYAFERQLKFKTEQNRNLTEDQLKVLFSAGGMLIVTQIYQLGPWTFVEYPTSEAANKGFEAVSKADYFRMNSLFRTNELIAHLRNSGSGADGEAMAPHRERPAGGREKYPFERQLKFRSSENSVLTANYNRDYNQVKELFTGGGCVTKVYELGPWTFVEYPTMEEADQAFDILFPQKLVKGLYRTNEMIRALREARGQSGLYDAPTDPYESGQNFISGPSTLTASDGEYIGWTGKEDEGNDDDDDDDGTVTPAPGPPGTIGINEDQRQSLENPLDPMNRPLQFDANDYENDRKGKKFVKDKPARLMPY